MQKRRGAGPGFVRQRGNTWTWYLSVRDPATQRRRQLSKGGFESRPAAQKALREELGRRDQGLGVDPSRRTLGHYLVDEWLPAIRATNLRSSTWESYRLNVEAHIVPALGQVELQRLTPPQLNRFYRDLLDHGRRDGRGGLAPKTVLYVHTILHRALKDARRWGFVVRNVADDADPPENAKRSDMQVWSPAELRRFLAHVQDDRLYAAWLLATTTGLRRGELLGLRRDVDLDLAAGIVRVRAPRVMVGYSVQVSEPKSERSRRTIALDPETVAALRAHLRRQLEERLAAGPGYRDSGLVFTLPDGRPIHPQRFSSWFEQQARSASLPRIRLHDLRHSYATAALAAGVPAKVVSERLGHATTAQTTDTYQHVLPAMDVEAAGVVARLILGTQEQSG